MGMYGFMLECEKQNKELTKNVEYYKNKSKRLETQLKKQKEIIDKAIEYIKEPKELNKSLAYTVVIDKLLSILEDKEV